MSLDTSGLRQRRTGVSKIVEDLDIFEKVVDNVKEEKKVSSGLISLICFSAIICLVVGELVHYISGNKEYDYRFEVDTSMDDMPTLDVDMVVATPCNNLAVFSTMDESGGIFAPLKQTIKKDPTRFELTDEEQLYWTVLRHAHSTMNEAGFRGLEELQYVDSNVEENLEYLANQKQQDEAAAISEQRKNRKDDSKNPLGLGQIVVMVGNGMGMFQIISSNSEDEGTACRVHGKFPVRKGKEETITISIGSALGMGIFAHIEGAQSSGNISHRIEKFNFGPRVRGLVAPLAGAEQISKSGHDIYRYSIKVVPTRIHGIFGTYTITYQYSVTFLKKQLAEGEHSRGGILFEYEFCANVIEVREVKKVHGKFPVRKGKEETITISIGSALGMGIFAHIEGAQSSGNISHRIEKFNFGPRVRGLVAPLAGAEQISKSGKSLIALFIRLCAVVGGVFATSRMINNIIQLLLSYFSWSSHPPDHPSASLLEKPSVDSKVSVR
ncbi:hypothetical protein COOONC_02127 [Cooperia oncophora]